MKTLLKSECEFKTVSEILENLYPQISKEVKKDYIIQYEDYDAFIEIENNGEIAGFYTLKQTDGVGILNEFYILKNHRGNNLTFNHLLDFISVPNTPIVIRNPNQNMIRVLLKNDLAIKIGNDLIFSAFPLIASSKELYKNPKIKNAYRNLGEETFMSAGFYDNNLKSVLSTDENLVKIEGALIVIEPRKNDIKKYGLRKKLKKVTMGLLDDKLLTIIDSIDDVQDFADKRLRELIELNSIDNLITSDNIDALSKDNNISKEDLKKSIEKSIKNGELDERCTKTRLAYLLENPEKINSDINKDLLPDRCPFCGSDILDTYSECPICGYNLNPEVSIDDLKIDGDNKLYRDVVKKADENNWDLDEIFDMQCLCGTFEFILMSESSRSFEIENVDVSNKVKTGSVANYAIENGYLKKCSYEDYIDLIENKFSKEQLRIEADYHGLNQKITKRGLIKEIKNNVRPEDVAVKYIATEKGIDLYENSEILKFYMNYLRTFLFCEFKIFFDEHDYPLSEAGDEFIKTEYEKGIKNKNWRVYKQLLKYNFEKTDNPKDCMKLAQQMLIYDINCDDLNDIYGLGFELDTAMYIMSLMPLKRTDLHELFEQAFEEFEIEELRHNKNQAFDIFTQIAEGNFMGI